MTPRSIRRAAERKARKLAMKEARLQPLAAREDEPALSQRGEEPNDEPALSQRGEEPNDEPALSQRGEDSNDEPKARKLAEKEARLEANRANSQCSTGPRTPQGKAISSLNAVKTGLTGRTVVLPSDDAAAYQQHVAAYEKEYKPVGLRECELVQSLADTRWRLNRIPKLEAAIYAQGEAEYDDPTGTELQTYLKYEKQLKNLHLQEARLNRRFDKDLAELRQLQKQRQAEVAEANGFEFSTTDRDGLCCGAGGPSVCDINVHPRSSAANNPAVEAPHARLAA
jgi:hypothetical protein